MAFQAKFLHEIIRIQMQKDRNEEELTRPPSALPQRANDAQE